MFDDPGWTGTHGNTVKYPGAAGAVTVMLRATLCAEFAMPFRPVMDPMIQTVDRDEQHQGEGGVRRRMQHLSVGPASKSSAAHLLFLTNTL
jgi:hypothetical protein